MSNIHKLPIETKLSFGQVLRSELIRLELDQTQLSEKLGKSRATINNLINNKYSASRAIAEKLADVFDRPLEFWLRSEYQQSDLLPHHNKFSSEVQSPKIGRLSNVGILELIDSGVLGLNPLERRLIQPASIDLRAGRSLENNNQDVIRIDNQAYWLAPQESVLVTTEEKLRLPDTIAGNIGGMGRLAKKFLVYGIGYEIDPGFEGHLSFTITNFGSNHFRVSAGMPIITVMFYRLAEQSSQEWKKPANGNFSVRKMGSDSRLGDVIHTALEAMHQTSEHEGLLQHSMKGTNLRLQTSKKIEYDKLFTMFLEEIGRFRVKINDSDDESAEKLGPQFDETWRILDSIKTPLSHFLSSRKTLAPLLEDCDPRLIEEWEEQFELGDKGAETTLGVQAGLLGLTSMDIILQTFDRLDADG